MYILCFYVPEVALETVKEAVFTAGAGRIGHYEHCCWQVKGQGQFRPLPGSKPTIGAHDELEYVDGEIYANVWLTDLIARISPADGRVLGWIDLAGLLTVFKVYRSQQEAVQSFRNPD